MANTPVSRAGTLYLLHVLTHATRTRIDAALTSKGLSSFQFTVLSVIAHNEGLSSSRLSRRFHVTPQAMGEIIIMLERRGLIRRVEDPGNRKVLQLSVTAEGAALEKAAAAIVAQIEKDVFAGVPEAELGRLRALVSTVLDNVRRPLPGAAK